MLFSVVVIFAAFSGLAMVVGGIWLIYKGAIILSQTDSANALSIEWKKDFKLSTQVPGIAFFVLGLAFSVVTIFAAKPPPPPPVEPFNIRGTINGVSDAVTIRVYPSASSWTVTSDRHGTINDKIYPDMDVLTLEFIAPGYERYTVNQRLSETNGRLIAIDESVVLNKVIPVIVGSQENIEETGDLALVPITEAASFGEPQ